MFKKSHKIWLAIAMVMAIVASVSIVAFAVDYIDGNENPVNMLVTNATEDCKTSVNVTWHSPVNKCTIAYTYADDTSFADAVVVEVDGVAGTVDYYDQAAGTYYKYAYTITGLTEDTKYIY